MDWIWAEEEAFWSLFLDSPGLQQSSWSHILPCKSGLYQDSGAVGRAG